MVSVHQAYEDMKPHRERAKEAKGEFTGRMSQNFGSPEEVPINKVRQLVRIYMRLMASGSPRAFVDTQYGARKPFAATLALVLNRHLSELNLEDAIYRAVLNAMFSFGVLKTGLAESDEGVEIDGVLHDAGKSFTRSIEPDHFVIDTQKSDLDDIDFIGDRYRRPKSWIQKIRDGTNGNFGRSGETLEASRMKPEDRVSGISEDQSKRLYKEVWCWDIYLPKQNIVCLYVEGDDDPIQVYEYNGPERGPYDLIGFDWLPGEVLPSAPVPALVPLHSWINCMARKLEQQTRRQRQIIAFKRGADDADAETLRTSQDGGAYGFYDPKAVEVKKLDGPDPLNHNMTMWGIGQFDEQAGGLQVLSGTQPMAETAKQEILLHQTANTLIAEMQRQVRRVISVVVKKHAWYIWTDPIRTYTATRPVPGLKAGIPVAMEPEVREGDFLDYNFVISPYSLQEETPADKAAAMIQFWQLVMANMALYQAQGVMPDAQAFTERLAELQNLDIGDFFVPIQPGMQGGQEQQGMVQPPSQFRRFETVNTRISKPGATQAGNMKSMMDSNSRLAASNAE